MDMFLSMLTADAASRHGHEFSSRTSQPSPRLPLLRSPLSVLPSTRPKPLPGPSPLGPGKGTVLPKRSRSLRVTMAELKEDPEDEVDDDDHISRLRIPGAFHPLRSRSRSLLNLQAAEKVELPAKSSEAPSALPPPTQLESGSGDALPVPLPKRTPRPKTQYRLAHPPPLAKAKPINKHIRPRVLLQLQQRTASGFHRPVYEIVPASRFSSNTKIGQKFNRLHKLRGRQLAADDLVVIKVEDYKTSSDATPEELESCDCRCVVGIICASTSNDGQSADGALLCLENSFWRATADKDGRYDLALLGDETQIARWYVPKAKRRRPGSVSGPEDVEDRKFYFATIQPGTTKHPTIASMNGLSMDVYESYSSPGTLSRSSPIATPTDEITQMDLIETPNKSSTFTGSASLSTDPLLRKLIILSGSWVFFKEGWSPYFEYPSNPDSSASSAPSCPQQLHQRSTSLPVDGLVLPPQLRPRQDSSNPIAKLVRSSTTMIRSHRNSLTPAPLSYQNSNSLPPSASSSERSPSPMPPKHRNADFVRGRLVRLATLPNVTFTSRSPSPLPSPASDPLPVPLSKQVTFAEPAQPPLAVDGSGDKLDDSEESDSPVDSPYWRDFDKLVNRRVQEQMMDGPGESADLRVYAMHGSFFSPPQPTINEPPSSTQQEPERNVAIGEAKGQDFASAERANTDSPPASTTDSTRTIWGSISRRSSVRVERDSSAKPGNLASPDDSFKLRYKLKKWEAMVKSKGELAGSRARRKKAEFDANQRRKKEEKEKRKEEKAAQEKAEKEKAV